MKTKLQIAVDTLSPQEMLNLIADIYNYIDIVELGTPYLLKYGINVIEDIKKISENLEILCDSKIMDAGHYEADELFKNGADYVTVLAVADHETLVDSVKAARLNNKKIVADMICVKDLKSKVEELEQVGVDVIAVHTGVDQQALGKTPLDDLREIKKYCKKTEIAVAGGINVNTVKDYIKYSPDIIIVGGGILISDNPVEEARKLYEAINHS